MNCGQSKDLIHAYLDRELDLVRTMEMERHLETCAECSESLQRNAVLQTALRGKALYHQAPATLRRKIRASIAPARRSTIPSGPVAWRFAAIAATAALAVALSWNAVLLFSRPSEADALAQEVVASHVRSLMADHLTDVLSTDQHAVKPWFSGKLDFSPAVRDLADQGFTLVGGRLDYVKGRQVASLVYQRRKHFINVFLWPNTQRGNTEPRQATRDGYSILYWKHGGFEYWAVSDLNTEELQQLARLLRN